MITPYLFLRSKYSVNDERTKATIISEASDNKSVNDQSAVASLAIIGSLFRVEASVGRGRRVVAREWDVARALRTPSQRGEFLTSRMVREWSPGFNLSSAIVACLCPPAPKKKPPAKEWNANNVRNADYDD